MRHLIGTIWLLAVSITSATELEDEGGFLDDSEFSAMIEKEMMAKFNAGGESIAPPRLGELLSNIDLTGTWRSAGGYDSTSLTFTPDSSGGYSVIFETAGCLGAWQFQRKAIYSGSTITLDLPVQEYLPATYTRLHAIRYEGEEYLLPSARVADFNDETGTSRSFMKMIMLSRTRKER